MNTFDIKFRRWWLKQIDVLAGAGSQNPDPQGGFALPLALGMGFVMIVLGLSMITVAQSDRITSWQRKESSESLAAAEGGMARTLAQLSAPNNAVLLNRNYDTINPKTNKTYLGPDGILNSGDEETVSIDEWTGYDPSDQSCHQQKNWGSPNFKTTGPIGSMGTYTLKAYRFNPEQQTGTFLVEANKGDQTTGVIITISVNPDLDDFPGIVLIDPDDNPNFDTGVLALRGREIRGSKANVYYVPSSAPGSTLTGSATPEAENRDAYLNAIWSTSQDGAEGDTVQGSIFACKLRPNIPIGDPGTNLGEIETSQTLSSTGSALTRYELEKIDLKNDDVLTVDTTNGPVQLNLIDGGNRPELAITLRGNAKILNIRTDGKPPRVGDLRIIAKGDSLIRLYDQTCIHNAFLWFPFDELRLLTNGPGCPGNQNTNFEGVLWMEAVLSAKQRSGQRNVEYLRLSGQEYDQPPEPVVTADSAVSGTETRVTAGIAVPEDVSSLIDLLKYIDWPVRYRFGGVQQWQKIRL